MSVSRVAALYRLLPQALLPIARIGVDPTDTEDARLKKAIQVTAVVLGGVPVQLGLGLLLAVFGEPLAGWLVFGCGALMLLGVVVFAYTRRYYEVISFCWLLITILSPFLSTLLLGGLVNAGFSQVWGFIVPLVSLILYSLRQTLAWFGAFLVTILVSSLLQPYLRPSNNLPPGILVALATINAIGVASLAFGMLLYFVQQRDVAFRLLRGEQEKAEQLLLNVLPADIAAILKDENRVIADQFEGASILFADVVNFTPMSAQMKPAELVELLNDVFSYFDALVDQYGLEKIKTIGDCYMVAAGVPRPRPNHATILARLALEIQAYVQSHTFHDRQLAFRIGINSGPVIAGVIGRRKFIYDLWGDAVNTASRMESQGTDGAIQITEATYALIKDEFVCEPRGMVQVKGKGPMPVWHVIREQGEHRLDKRELVGKASPTETRVRLSTRSSPQPRRPTRMSSSSDSRTATTRSSASAG